MIKTGDSVLLIRSSEQSAAVLASRVERTNPLTLVVAIREETPLLDVGNAVSVIWRGAHSNAHYETSISRITSYGLTLVIELAKSTWVEFDRRRGERYETDFEGEVTVVQEDPEGAATLETYSGRVVNVSCVGCLFKSRAPIERGCLVSVRIPDPLKSGEMRMLAIVTRIIDDAMGLEFFDFSGDSRVRLNNLLMSLEEKKNEKAA